MSDEQRQGAPFAGLRVLDLSTEISGAYCSKLFVDAGADVLKLEDECAPDPLRKWSASQRCFAPEEDGALFQYLNASKQGLAFDLSSKSGQEQALALAAKADIVVENFGPGGARARGLSWEAIHAQNPRTCLVSISNWGGEGPWADRPASEFTLQAAVGSTSFRGLPARGPVGAGGRLGEWIAGTYASVGALAAWTASRRSGVGRHVDLSTFESLMLAMTVCHDLNGQFWEGPLAQSLETPSIEPAKDGWVGLCTITGQQWKDFCAVIGRPDIGEDERFYDARRRMEHLDFIQEAIHAYTREHTIEEIIETCQLMRIPANPLGDGKTLPEMDHFIEREIFIENPAGFLQPRPPYRLHGEGGLEKSSSRLRVPGPAPAVAEHQAAAIARWSGELDRIARDGEPDGAALPFEGLKVVDLTAFWAGPVATAVFADFGADVVKVESVQRPDGMRFAGSIPHEQLWECCPIYHGANTGKRDLTLKLDSEEGMRLLKRLIEDADLVIENFSARVLDNFGLDWASLHALNPRAVVTRMPSFGLDGPWRDRVGFAMNIEQVSGLAWLTGYEDMPLVVRGSCDPLGGMHAVFATVLALEERRRTGKGQLVEVPLVEPAINVAAEQVIEQSAYGVFLERSGNRGPAAAPQGVYRCTDGGDVAIAVQDEAQWQALRARLESPALLAEELSSASARRAAHDDIDVAILRWLETRSAEEAAEELCAAGVPAQRCTNAHEVFPNPQLEAREFFQEMEHPVMGRLRYSGQPFSISGMPRDLHTSPPPLLGQHNEELLRQELGLDEAEIEKLRSDQIIGNRPSFM